MLTQKEINIFKNQTHNNTLELVDYAYMLELMKEGELGKELQNALLGIYSLGYERGLKAKERREK